MSRVVNVKRDGNTRMMIKVTMGEYHSHVENSVDICRESVGRPEWEVLEVAMRPDRVI